MKFVKAPFVVENVEIRQLKGSQVREALGLLYRVYVEEQGWIIPASNKSGLEIREDAAGKFLHDSLVEKAIWFGVLCEKNVVGCFRVLSPPYTELTHYIELPAVVSSAPASELNRLALAKEWRGEQKIMLALLRAAFDYAILVTSIVYTTAEVGKHSKLYRRLGLLPCESPPFKYDKNDPLPVDILYYDIRTASHQSTMLYRFTDHLAAENQEAQ
jgi:hypothetical protein